MVTLFIAIGSYLIRCIDGNCGFVHYMTLNPYLVAGTVELILEGIAGYIKIYKVKEPKDKDKEQ